MRNLLFLPVFLLLAGCVSFLPDYSNEDSGYRLVLHEPIVVPPQKARVYIQGGRIIGTGFDSYEVSCNIEVRKLSEEPQRIEPDTFVVNRIQQFFEEVAALDWQPVQLASVGLVGADVDGGLSYIFRGWHFWLSSPTQPQMFRMTCRGVFAPPWEAYLPTLEEIAWTLGKVATLKPVSETIEPGKF